MSKRKSVDALAYGNELKNRVEKNLYLTPDEKKLFGQVDVYAEPDKFFENMEKEEDSPFQYLGEAPYQPFAAAPFYRPYVNIRQKPIVPKLTFGNTERFGQDGGYITPEEVLPHEMGHVASQVLNPEKQQRLKFGNLDDEGFAVSFDHVVSGRGKPFNPSAAALIRKIPKANKRFQKMMFNPE